MALNFALIRGGAEEIDKVALMLEVESIGETN